MTVAPTTGQGPLTMRKNQSMSDLLVLTGFVILWFALQMWILPKLGVST